MKPAQRILDLYEPAKQGNQIRAQSTLPETRRLLQRKAFTKFNGQ